MFKRGMTYIALLALLVSGAVRADEASVKKLLNERFADLPVQSVKKAPAEGWYEVLGGNQIFYTDEKVRYVFVGNLIETATKRNLTQERLRDLLRVKFDALPFDDSIKIVKGNGKRRIAVFEDPDCPFCKRLEAELAKLDNYTLHVFLLPLDSLHPDASAKSKKVWCAKDRAKAWIDLMLSGKVPANKGDCATPLQRIAEVAQQLNIQGTPAVVFEDGRLVPGAIPKEKLDQMMTEAAAQQAKPAEAAKDADKSAPKETAK